MKDSKKIKYIGIGIALCTFILCGTIVYAGFTKQLDIQGKATVKKSSWAIKFTNLQSAVKTGTATEVTAPTINTNDTKISEYDVTLTTPGDSITYNFDVKNEGTFDAKISSITIPTPTCTGTGTTATTDENNVCNNITYTLTYSADVESELLPSDDVAISNLAIAIIYAQDENN